jgi:hypothetical protein
MAEDPTKDTGTEPGGEPKADPKTPGVIDPEKAAAKYRREAKAAKTEAEKIKADLDAANARLAEIDEANKTEAQKAAEAAERAKKDAEIARAELHQERLGNAIARDLLARGYKEEFVPNVLKHGKIDSPDGASDAVAGWLEKMEWPEKMQSGERVPSFGNAPKPPEKSEPKDLDAMMAMPASEFNKPENFERFKKLMAERRR